MIETTITDFFLSTACVVGSYRVAVDRVPESSTSRRVHHWLPPRMESGPDHVENNGVTIQPSNEIRKNIDKQKICGSY